MIKRRNAPSWQAGGLVVLDHFIPPYFFLCLRLFFSSLLFFSHLFTLFVPPLLSLLSLSQTMSTAEIQFEQQAVPKVVPQTSQFKAFLSGGFGGVAAVLVGHPFDLAKVKRLKGLLPQSNVMDSEDNTRGASLLWTVYLDHTSPGHRNQAQLALHHTGKEDKESSAAFSCLAVTTLMGQETQTRFLWMRRRKAKTQFHAEEIDRID